MESTGFGLRTINRSEFGSAENLCDVIVVHGLYGSSHSSWTDIRWEDDFLPPLRHAWGYVRLSLYTYDVFGSSGGILTPRRARDEATRLLDSLIELRGRGSQNMPIVFVGHDLGGSLVKEVVVLSQQEKYEDIYISIALMVFLGCPHQGLKVCLQASCANLLLSHQETTYSEAWNLSGSLVDWIQATNDSFAETRISSISTTFVGISTHLDTTERVFDRFTTSMLSNQDAQFPADLGHRNLLKHPMLISLGNKVEQMNWPSDAVFRRRINQFASHAPPQYSINIAPSNEEKPVTFPACRVFLEFMKSDGAGCWLVHTPPPGCSAIEAAEQVLQCTEDFIEQNFWDGPVQFFSFDADNGYKDSAEAALHSILANHCSRSEERFVAQEALKYLDICHSAQIQDLYYTWLSLVLLKLKSRKDTLLSSQGATFTIILGNLDGRIKDGIWLYKRLEDIVQDCGLRLKIIVTSADPTSLTPTVEPATLFESPETGPACTPHKLVGSAKSEGQAKLRNSLNDVKKECGRDDDIAISKSVLTLIQHRPRLYHYSAALKLLAQSCGKDEKLWKMVSNWLKDLQVPHEDQLQDLISQLIPATHDKVFVSILTSLPLQVRSWSISLLELVLFAFRPLTVGELGDLVLLYRLDEPQHEISGSPTLDDIPEKICGGLIMVQQKEIRLAHPKLREFLLTYREQVPGTSISFDSASSVHERIATACLDYLSSPQKRQLMTRRAEIERRHTSFEYREDFLSYAVKYWLRHAMCADREIFASDDCTRFLADDEGVRLWIVLYQRLSPPAVKEDRLSVNILASLAIFAEHEAEDLLILTIKKYQHVETRDLSFACFAALVAAAGRGSIRMVKELLGIPLPEEKTLEQPMLAAIESGNKEVFSEIVNLVRKTRGGVQDFQTLLARAASLGHVDFVKALLDMKHVSDIDRGSSCGLSPLSYACQRGHQEVVKLLIHEGGTAVMSELQAQGQTPLPIRLAIQFAETNILNILRLAVAERPKDPTAIGYYRSVFAESSGFCRRKPVRNVLDYIDSHSLRGTSASTSTSSDEIYDSKKVDEETILISYLSKIIGGYSNPAATVMRVISQWPHALDLLDFLTRSKRMIMSMPQFPSDFETWIKTAVSSGDITVVKLLFENGAGSQLATPEVLEHVATLGFEAALLNQFIDGMRYFIEKGASFASYSSLHGRTPLFEAVYRGFEAATKLLIEEKVDVNEKGNEHWFPIHACYDNADITRQLIAAGADINMLTISDRGEGIPPLVQAVGGNFPEVVDEHLKANPSRKTIQSALQTAIWRDRTRMVERILPCCPDASYLPDVNILLHFQVRRSNLKIIRTLLNPQYQLDVNRMDSLGNTALHYISNSTSVEVVELLIAHGAGIELINSRGFTPLCVATKAPNNAVVECLVRHGARINTAAGSLDGPFILACHHGSLDMVKIMHTSKTDPAKVNHVNPRSLLGTALNAALLRLENTDEKQTIINYLLEEGSGEVNIRTMFWGNALQAACLTSTVETVRMLIDQHGSDVNVKDNVGRTPLHIALYRTREYVELLRNRGADLDDVDITQRTALHFAVLSGRLDVVKLVLDQRPEFVNHKDVHGWTPLLWALRVTGKWGTQTSEIQSIVQELLDRGAHRLVRGDGVDRTWTPMKIAKYYRINEEITKLLEPKPVDFEKMGDHYRDWDWKLGGGKRAIVRENTRYCDHCLLALDGLWYSCLGDGCDGRMTAYCLHCYQSWNKLHIPGHEGFDLRGREEDDLSDAGGDSTSDGSDSELETESDG
ncbi:hypothetical protein F5Y03DRAFT_401842 [Xylaria venustula]|nr:hypothetical protein F5Y03DRAFT_401842 [Xylaria venustula]